MYDDVHDHDDDDDDEVNSSEVDIISIILGNQGADGDVRGGEVRRGN